MSLPPLSRRALLKSGLAAAAYWSLPRFSIAQGGPAPSRKLNLAFVGVGGIGGSALSGCEGENYVAFCDVDEARAAGNYAKHPGVPRFKDFRVMLEKMHREIDAVIVSTPDHTHFAAAILAMERGKHVYVQKPLTHDIWQARTLRRAAHHYKVVTQMGNQGHATEGIRLVKEWYESGALGEVREVHAWLGGPDFAKGVYFQMPKSFPPETSAVPASLDWDLWLGPAKHRTFSGEYVPLRWRGWWDFGTSILGDWACHTLDAPFWALGLGQPTRVSVVNLEPIAPGFSHRSSHIKFEFPARAERPPVTLHWYDGGQKPPIPLNWNRAQPWPGSGMIMVGSKATLMTSGRPDSPRLLLPDADWEAFRRNPPTKTIPRVQGGPFREWIRAIKGEGPAPGSNFDYAAELTEMSLLGVLAQRANRDIVWDAQAMRVTNVSGLEGWVREPARRGWRYGDNVWKT